MISAEQLKTWEQFATYMAKAGIGRKNILNKTTGEWQQVAPNAAEFVVLFAMGHELGYNEVGSYRSFYIRNGQFGTFAETMLYEAEKRGVSFEYIEMTDEKCTIKFSKQGRADFLYTYTLQEAKRAGLLGKEGSSWHKIPKIMLKNRCISNGVRAYVPGAATKMYTDDEIDEIITPPQGSSDVIHPPPEPPEPPPQPTNTDSEPPSSPAESALQAKAEENVKKTAATSRRNNKAVYRFAWGAKKDKPITEGTILELEKYAESLRRMCNDPNKIHFKEMNLKTLAAVEAERDRKERIMSDQVDSEYAETVLESSENAA